MIVRNCNIYIRAGIFRSGCTQSSRKTRPFRGASSKSSETIHEWVDEVENVKRRFDETERTEHIIEFIGYRVALNFASSVEKARWWAFGCFVYISLFCLAVILYSRKSFHGSSVAYRPVDITHVQVYYFIIVPFTVIYIFNKCRYSGTSVVHMSEQHPNTTLQIYHRVRNV